MQGQQQQAQEKLLTAEELARLAIDRPCELVDGRIVFMSPASGEHGLVASQAHSLLANFVDPRGLGAVTSAETGFLVRRNPDHVRAPDVAFVSKELIARYRASGETFFPQAPELAVEVLSPDDSWERTLEKVREYLAAHGKLVWVVSPLAEQVYVFAPAKPVRVLGLEDQLDGGEALPGFRAPVAVLFGRTTTS